MSEKLSQILHEWNKSCIITGLRLVIKIHHPQKVVVTLLGLGCALH